MSRILSVTALVLAVAFVAGCSSGAAKPGGTSDDGRNGRNGGAAGGGGSGTSGEGPARAGSSDREQRFFRVDTLVTQWDSQQADGKEDEAKALASQIADDVDKGFPDFASASRGEAGLKAQYLAVKALAFSRKREATTLLVARLAQADLDGDLVSNVLIALKVREDPATPLPPLVALLRTPSPEIRKFAPLAFANVLLARERAGMTLDATTSQQAFSNLVGLVQDHDPFVRLHTAKALGALRRPEANDLLVLLLKDDHLRIRLAAAAALERIGDPRSFPKVVELLDASDSDGKVLVRDILVSYAERLQGAPLSEAQKAELSVSPRAWDRWFSERSNAVKSPAGPASPAKVR